MYRYDTRCEACLFGKKHDQLEHEEYIFDWYAFNSPNDNSPSRETSARPQRSLSSDPEINDQL